MGACGGGGCERVASLIALVTAEALKCKTLGGIHIHHALSHIEQGPSIHTMAVYILRMRVQVPRCPV